MLPSLPTDQTDDRTDGRTDPLSETLAEAVSETGSLPRVGGPASR